MATTVKLAGKEYSYRLDMGALLVFEQFAAKMPEELKTPQRLATVMYYACLYAGEGFEMSYDEFLDTIDSVEVLESLCEASAAENKRWGAKNLASQVAAIEEEKDGESKKK